MGRSRDPDEHVDPRHDAALAELTASLSADILDGLISTGEIRRPDDAAHVEVGPSPPLPHLPVSPF